MSTAGAQAGLETFDALHIEYENAYKDNLYKQRCIQSTIALLEPGARCLDVGCGTGVPVAQMLASAGMEVVGTDIAPKMIALARSQVKGTFLETDMLTYQPEGEFDAVLMIFCHLQLSYKDFHTAAYKFASTLRPGGLFIIGEMPADRYVKDVSSYDKSGSWVEDYPAPFFGEALPTFMMTEQGLLHFLKSMGFEIISNTVDTFQPSSQKCDPEEQQYVIARRLHHAPVKQPQPQPLPRA
ncbi:hypothetical protein LTR78_003333 [Recurvomyces mirabilis]|uniref:Methyltransferase domain-containing protein n=1 Tax=Recurvomyces mirabilis TaxID=574656 RepID=A0AAE0WSQ4_9PEZI|nr:hypothetical protein LTR78_003333 [Recurvomyces mirabilis]KAK5156850.1 hypothetical protein LTS14_004367 [Recurvomyces mirabilis]